MQIVNLYRYVRPDGGVTVSTVQPNVDYIPLYRLIADEGMILTDGNTRVVCTDTSDTSIWTEIEHVQEPDDVPNAPENNTL